MIATIESYIYNLARILVTTLSRSPSHRRCRKGSRDPLLGRLGSLLDRLGGLLGRPGDPLGRLGGFLGRLGRLLGRRWGPLGPPWGPLGPSGAPLGRFGVVVGPFRSHPRSAPRSPGPLPGPSRDPPRTPPGPSPQRQVLSWIRPPGARVVQKICALIIHLYVLPCICLQNFDYRGVNVVPRQQ